MERIFGVFTNREAKGSHDEWGLECGKSKIMVKPTIGQKESYIATFRLLVDHKVEEHDITDRPHGNDEVVTQRYDHNSIFCSSHNSLLCHEI